MPNLCGSKSLLHLESKVVVHAIPLVVHENDPTNKALMDRETSYPAKVSGVERDRRLSAS